MNEDLQKLIHRVCSSFPTQDVEISNVFDLRRFAHMVHYAWKNEIGFNPAMFKDALKNTENFQSLSEEELDVKSSQLCRQADFAKALLHASFELEHLKI